MKGRTLWLFGSVLLILVAALAGTGYLLLRPKPGAPETAESAPFCRQCAALSRLENTLSRAMARDEEFSSPTADLDRTRIVNEVVGWQRRCSTLLCSQPATQAGLACAAPPASLISELASIDALSESLMRRTSLCATGGCQSARCDQASSAQSAFSDLHEEIRVLSNHPDLLAGESRQVSTSFLFDQLGTLDMRVLAAPGFVASGRFAAAEGSLLSLRDQAVEAEANSPDSAEGLLADRLEEVSSAIEALAQARRSGLAGPGLVSLWSDFADSSARLLVEAATLGAEMHAHKSLVQLFTHPEPGGAPQGQGKVCEGTLRLVEATEKRLGVAMGQLDLCNHRADCAGDEDTAATPAQGSAPPQFGSGSEMIEQLASLREAAASALRPLVFQKDDDVSLATDLKEYFSGEAIAVKALSQTNRCLSDRGSHLELARTDAQGGAGESVESHALDPADSAAWMFEAPKQAGTYRFVLETSKSRGLSGFGASPMIVVSPTGIDGCRGFSGRWQTDFGTLTIYVRDGIARGSYRQSDKGRAGLFVGTVDSGVLTGEWTSELGDGGARLTLAADGRSFSGTWSQYPDRTSGTGKWDGQCLGPVLPDAAGPVPLQLQRHQG